MPPDTPDDCGWTALMCAASAGRAEVVRFLLSRADVRITVACCSEKLARPQVNSSHANANGQTPLHYAASKDHPEVRGRIDGRYGR